jgi:dihydroorotase
MKIDWHYHLSGKNIQNDIRDLNNYIKCNSMDMVYVLAGYFPEKGSGVSNFNLLYHIKNIVQTKAILSFDFEHYFNMTYNEVKTILNTKELKEKIVGIKIYTGYQKIDDAQIYKVLELANDNNLFVMIHAGFELNNIDIYDPYNFEKYIVDFPDIKFIIAHLGYPCISNTLDMINKYENVYSDYSGIIDNESEKEYLLSVVKTNLKDFKHKDRLLFGTDYPIQTYDNTLTLKNAIYGA